MNDDRLVEIAAMLAKNRRNYPTSYAFFRAAVLIPLIIKNGNMEILFEVRSKKLNWQPGEICFPGGKIDKTDSTPIEAAVRETSEELGVARKKITVLGTMDEIISPIGVMLYPTVGHFDDMMLKLNESEVAEVFTVPMSWLLKAEPRVAKMEMSTRPLENFPYELLPDYPDEWRKRSTYEVLFYDYQGYVIWGLTAYVLNQFIKMCRLKGE